MCLMPAGRLPISGNERMTEGLKCSYHSNKFTLRNERSLCPSHRQPLRKPHKHSSILFQMNHMLSRPLTKRGQWTSSRNHVSGPPRPIKKADGNTQPPLLPTSFQGG